MRKAGRLFIAAALFLAISVSFSCFAEGETAERKILDIQIKGNYFISSVTILNKLKIQPGDVFDEAALNKELKRIYAMGYFSDVSVEVEEKPDGVVVIFTVAEKPCVVEIKFQGNKRIGANRLRKKITTKEGDLVDFNVLSQDVSEIRAFYMSEGYYRAKVDYKIESDESKEKATLIFAIDEGEPLKIREVRFKSNKAIPSGELGKYMETKPAFFFLRKGTFDQSKFDADLERLSAVYRRKGYLDAKAAAELSYSPDGKELKILVVLDEGKRYSTGEFTIEGNLSFPEAEIRKLVKMKPLAPFDYEVMKSDVENIRTFYYDKGYMSAEVDMQHRFNPSSGNMDLAYSVESGDITYVGKINVSGNTKTRYMVVRREIRVYPGEKYDGARLRKSKERIYNLGFFEDVFLETAPTDKPGVKDLNVTVKETKTGEFSFGGGYSTMEAFIGFVQVRQKNFDILDFPTFTGGGQDLVVRAEAGSARTNYYLGWKDPWIFDWPFGFGFAVYRNEHKRFGLSGYGYDEVRTGGDLKVSKEFTDLIMTDLNYNLENVDISNIPDDATDELRKEEGTNLISRLTWNLTFDSRDNKYSPTRGFVSTLTLEDAGGFLMGDKDFLKGFLGGAAYFNMWEKIVLELRGSAGVSGPYGDSTEMPIYERFFAGGAETIRGYKERRVGPRDPGSNMPLGGESVVIGTAELTFPLFKNIIKGAVFYDVGNVWEKHGDIFNGGYKQGVGVGVRVKTPIGPIKLDYGFPLNKNYDDEQTGELYFSVSHGF